MSPINQWDQRVVGTRNLAATAATIAVVGLGVAAEPAFAAESGEPHAMSRQEANDLVYTRDEARKQVDPEVATFYAKEFGTSRVEAFERLTTQGVAPNLQAPLAEALGDEFAGLWFDNEDGDWVVRVEDDSSARAAEKVLERLGLGGYSRVDQVGYSRTELSSLMASLGQQLMSDLKGEVKTGRIGLAAESVEVKLPDTASAGAREKVSAVVEKATGEYRQVPVKVEYVDSGFFGDSKDYGCSFPNCAVMTGGVRYWTAQYGCTAAFKSGPALPAISSAATHWLTAGHCLPQGAQVGNLPIYHSSGNWSYCSLQPSGSCNTVTGGTAVAQYNTNGFGDGGLMAATNGVGQPNVAHWKNNQTNYHAVQGWHTSSAPIGTAACLSGATSGTNCGTVVSTNFSSPGTWKGMIEVAGGTICPRSGDSGGAMVGAGYMAMGMHSASRSDDDCSIEHSIVEPVHRAVALFGSEPLVNP